MPIRYRTTKRRHFFRQEIDNTLKGNKRFSATWTLSILTYNIHVHTTPTRKQVTYVKESHGDLLSTCFQEYKKKVLYIQLQLTNSKQTCFHPSGPPKVTSQSQFCRLRRLPILLICWVSYTKCCTTVVVKCFINLTKQGRAKTWTSFGGWLSVHHHCPLPHKHRHSFSVHITAELPLQSLTEFWCN